MDTYGMVEETLDARLDELAGQAQAIVDTPWRLVMDREKEAPGWESKSKLILRCKKVGGSLNIEWAGIKWWGSKVKGTRKKSHVYIKKPKDAYGYSLDKLYAHCKDWEKPLVKDTEEKLVVIRREARHINKALVFVRFARNAVGGKGDGQGNAVAVESAES